MVQSGNTFMQCIAEICYLGEMPLAAHLSGTIVSDNLLLLMRLQGTQWLAMFPDLCASANISKTAMGDSRSKVSGPDGQVRQHYRGNAKVPSTSMFFSIIGQADKGGSLVDKLIHFIHKGVNDFFSWN